LTPNGKVDRRALPNPQGRPEELGEYVPPRTELEQALADVWIQLLQIDQVGVQDNFFDIGGHSLLATRVVTHISELLDIELPLRAIFENPTIEALSAYIVDEIAAEMSSEEGL
ncbi:phosphopantetheine-binding protein, partial [Steroidobacter flavus]